MSGPPPKPAHLRQRANKKATHAQLGPADGSTPAIPNPDGRQWHALTLQTWDRAWQSQMASQWLESDVDGLGRLAILWDEFYQEPKTQTLAEIRLQEQRFGLSPLDRSRLQWEVSRADEAGVKQSRRAEVAQKRTGTDPRRVLQMVK